MENKKLAIRGCSELKKYFERNGVENLSGNIEYCIYFEDSNATYGWEFSNLHIEFPDEYKIVSFEEYFKRNKMLKMNFQMM